MTSAILKLSDLSSASTESLLELAREHAAAALVPELLPSPATGALVLERTVLELRHRVDRLSDVEQLLKLSDIATSLRYAIARQALPSLPWASVWALEEETADRLKAVLGEPAKLPDPGP